MASEKSKGETGDLCRTAQKGLMSSPPDKSTAQQEGKGV